MIDIEGTDRYQLLGVPYPDPETMCPGDCEGTGMVPIPEGETDPRYVKLWNEAEVQEPSDDGWHFVTCPDCLGSRLKAQS